MRSFTTAPSPIVRFGEGEAMKLGGYLQEKHVKTVLLVHGRTLFQTGVITAIMQTLEEDGFTVFTYDGIEPESPDYVVKDLALKARETKTDAVVAIGGGSTIDTARVAMSLRYAEGDLDLYISGEMRLEEPTKDNGLLICIPTTSGTGAEMSIGGPILDTKNNIKRGLLIPPRYTDYVILDPTLTVGLSPYLTYTTAMDALCHSLEGMTGERRSHRTDMICGQAVEYIWRSLPIAMEDGTNLEARGELLLAANLAIWAETMRHIGHAVSQPIGAKLHLPHGLACALVLPATIRAIADVSEIQRELKLIASKMGLDSNSPNVGHEIADAIAERNRMYQIPSLKEQGFRLEEVLNCIPIIMQDKRLLPIAPFAVTEQHIEAILKEMYQF